MGINVDTMQYQNMSIFVLHSTIWTLNLGSTVLSLILFLSQYLFLSAKMYVRIRHTIYTHYIISSLMEYSKMYFKLYISFSSNRFAHNSSSSESSDSSKAAWNKHIVLIIFVIGALQLLYIEYFVVNGKTAT